MRGSSATTEPFALAELLGGDALQVGAHREREVADAVLVDEEVAELLERQLGRAPGQLVVVGLLDARAAEREAEEAGDVGEQLALGVLPLVLEAVVDGTDRAITTPSAVVTLPRGWLKSRRISRVLFGLSLSSAAWNTVSRLSCTNSTAKQHDQAEPEQRGSAGSSRLAGRPRWPSGGVVGDAQEEREQHVVGDERRPAVGHERQRDAGEGQHADDAGDDDERLHADQHGEPGREQALERHLGAQRDAQAGADHQQVGDQHRAGADEAELLADGGEDEVGLGRAGSAAGCRG